MAEYLAKWGNKGFLVTPNKLVPLLSLSTGFSRKSDTANDTSGTPTTNTQGMELQQIKLETRYVAGLGVDPRGQIEEWRNQFGLRYPLYINGKQFGPNLLELVSVDVSNILMDNKGNFLSVDISVTLEEYDPATVTTTSPISTAETTSSSSSSSSAGTTYEAMVSTASSLYKQLKKNITTREEYEEFLKAVNDQLGEE